MYVSARERQLIEVILTHNEAIPVHDLAAQLEVSTRTVHRDLQALDTLLNAYELSLTKKSGTGVRIEGADEQKRRLLSSLDEMAGVEYTPKERRAYMLCELLDAHEPVKLHALSHDLKVTVATVSHDLDELETWLTSLGLELIRKRGYGVKVEGSERARRRALSQLLVNNIDESTFVSVVKQNLQDKVTHRQNLISNRLLGLVHEQRLRTVEAITEQLVAKFPYKIADSAFIGLTVHLALAIERLIQGEEIAFDPETLQILQASEEYAYAQELADRVEEQFNIKVPDEEIGFITMHLRGAKLRNDQAFVLEDTNMEVATKVKQLIKAMEKQTGTELSTDPSLFKGLVVHLERALYRIQQHLRIDNPLLGKVKEDYATLFILVKESMDHLFPDIDIPDAEIGFLVMHIGSVLEYQRPAQSLSALTICSSGIGSSKMLATRIRKDFPEIEQLQNASLFDLNHIDVHHFDVIISTIPLPIEESEYILVNPFLTEEDTQKIHAAMNQHQYEVKKSETLTTETQLMDGEETKADLNFFQNVKEASTVIMKVMKHFQLMAIDGKQTTHEVLLEACQSLAQKGAITTPETIVRKLKRRESQGGLGIPGTTLALYHARNDAVVEPSFTIYALEHPLTVQAMDGSSQAVHRVLLLLSPDDFSETGLELLSLISALMIESESITNDFETGTEKTIHDLLSGRFRQYLIERMQ
ncbi:BglG family transcription antiterminator [Tuberibacillus sp. Marseille-P3662]|uniref:BglG family transcription antiterminator n=1 Tax=Tuberibacillus sp. Marseille-P3662 TaxID=1965358 RepID=UPI000A1CC2AA|nr:BglG family transcription antiterminator [Tuberibacillus sp. Marseille-P3662]